jgi:hypothetical protein
LPNADTAPKAAFEFEVAAGEDAGVGLADGPAELERATAAGAAAPSMVNQERSNGPPLWASQRRPLIKNADERIKANGFMGCLK